MSPSSTPKRARKGSGCPLCGATPSSAYTPFCSQGCRDRDLLNWLGEGYRMPGRPVDPSDASDAEQG